MKSNTTGTTCRSHSSRRHNLEQHLGAVISHPHHLSQTSSLQESLELEQSRRRTLERQLADISHVSPRSPRVTDPRMQALDQQVGG